jgi:excisionase family DNA binding protein
MFGGLTLLSTRLVARRLRVSPGCVAQWIRRGFLPAERSGKIWVVRSDDLLRFSETHQRGQHFFKPPSHSKDRT